MKHGTTYIVELERMQPQSVMERQEPVQRPSRRRSCCNQGTLRTLVTERAEVSGGTFIPQACTERLLGTRLLPGGRDEAKGTARCQKAQDFVRPTGRFSCGVEVFRRTICEWPGHVTIGVLGQSLQPPGVVAILAQLPKAGEVAAEVKPSGQKKKFRQV